MLIKRALFLLLIIMLISITQSSLLATAGINKAIFGINNTPLPAEQIEGVYLEIDKNKNTLFVYLNGYIVYRFKVATGKDPALTPTGTFKIITKVKNPWYLPKNIPGGDKNNPLGTRWLGLNVPGTGGYTYGIHGTNNPASIGHHISQGCIRMYNKDVEWLYRHIPLNTTVIIKQTVSTD